MGENFKVIFAHRAERDLKNIVHYISKHAGSEIAERFGIQLVEKALTLNTFPKRGRVVPEVGEPFREIIFRSFVYRLSGDLVEVIRFWHAARGVPQIDSDEFGSQA